MTHPVKAPRKLIEVALPLDAINEAAAREKSIRHGHPSTLHLWWARRPLAAARAVIFAQLVNDPAWKWELEHPGEVAPNNLRASWAASRKRLFKIIEDLVQWENTTNEEVLEPARKEIRKSWLEVCELNRDHPEAEKLFNPEKMPGLHDPFAGGGTIPLEAQRLGLESFASDLNPVAVLINKAMIEIPPKFAGRPPVHPSSQKSLFQQPPGTRASRPEHENPGTRASRPEHEDTQRLHPESLPSRPHKQWHSRGYLPHLDTPGLVQSITFRLHDSVPLDVIASWKSDLGWLETTKAEDPKSAELRRRIDTYADAGHGGCWLAQPEIARLVENALLHFDGTRYRLMAWCVMPNHVHVLIDTVEGHPLGDIVHSWKSFTAKEANKVLGRTGEFWMPDYYDRFIRDEHHLHAEIRYIEDNPVKAGLVAAAADWEYSSAIGAAGTAAVPRMVPVPGWKGAQGLAEDVRHYGQWMRNEAQKRIGTLYPPIEITAELAKERPDLKPYVGQKLTVIAWLWARTVKSPHPAFSHVDVPLASTFILSSKEGKVAYVEPVLKGDAYHFEVRVGRPPDNAKGGTKLARGANFACLMSGTPMAGDYIKGEGKAGRMGARLMAIVVEGTRGRVYLAPTPEHEAAARKAAPEWKPEQSLPDDPRNFWTIQYGLTTFGDLFTPRQLVALTTFSDLVGEAMQQVRRDALQAGLPDDPKPLRDGGSGATAYAEAVGVYLGFIIEKETESLSTICTWSSAPKNELVVSTFRRQAIPMTWDFAEANPFAESSGSIDKNVAAMSRVMDIALSARATGSVKQHPAQTPSGDCRFRFLSTDPPYYDNIGYADLSDFFYVWLRRSLRGVFPDLFATLAVPKAEELVATPYRHGSKEKAETFFLDGMTLAMKRLAEQAHPSAPVTIYYAFKQSETMAESGTSSTGWETFLQAVSDAGLALTGTWPMRTERDSRSIGIGTNALASSIVLVCRKRAPDAKSISRRAFLRELHQVLPQALELMLTGSGSDRSPVAPVDLSQAIIGPGMAVYSKYAAVLEADGTPMPVKTALQLINRFLAESDFDADTQFCSHWFETYGWNEGPFGEADVLARAKATSVNALVTAGVVQSGGGKVRILRWTDYPDDWDPQKDARIADWEILHQLIRVHRKEGDTGAGRILKAVAARIEAVRLLAFRLYTLCERKGWAEDARAYNLLVTSWEGIETEANAAPEVKGQLDLFGGKK